MRGESPSPEALEAYSMEPKMSLTPPSPTEIRVFRLQMALTQAALAEALGASTRAVEQWESGRRAPPAMMRLAMAALREPLEPWSHMVPPRGRIMRAPQG